MRWGRLAGCGPLLVVQGAKQPRRSEASTGSQDDPSGLIHPNKGWVLWTVEASSNATATSVCAGQSLCGAPGIEPATPSLPWNHREPLCGTPFPPARARPSGPKLSVHFRRSYAFSGYLLTVFGPCPQFAAVTNDPERLSSTQHYHLPAHTLCDNATSAPQEHFLDLQQNSPDRSFHLTSSVRRP